MNTIDRYVVIVLLGVFSSPFEVGTIVGIISLLSFSIQLLSSGHSLVAGAATLSAFILRSRFPKLTTNQQLRVYAFGPPPVLDRDSAVAAASFCTSVVNNADIIPRCSLYNFAVFLECLRKVQLQLIEKEMNPAGLISTKAFIDKLSEGTSGELLMTVSELHKTAREASEQTNPHKPEHMYIPGRVILPYNPWIEDFEGEDDDDIDQLQPEQKHGCAQKPTERQPSFGTSKLMEHNSLQTMPYPPILRHWEWIMTFRHPAIIHFLYDSV